MSLSKNIKIGLRAALVAVALVVGSMFALNPATATSSTPTKDVSVVAICGGLTVTNTTAESVEFQAGTQSIPDPSLTRTLAPGESATVMSSLNPLHWESNVSSGQRSAGFGNVDTKVNCPTATPTPVVTPTPEPTATPTPVVTPTPAVGTPAPKTTKPVVVPKKPAAAVPVVVSTD